MKKLAGIAAFTLIETIGVGLAWDVFYDESVLVASLAGFGFFVLEHVVAKNVDQGLPWFRLRGSNLSLQVLLGVTETLLWDMWRVVQSYPPLGPLVAMAMFAFLLIPQHNAELNVNSGAPLLANLWRAQTILISVVESFTAFAWFFYEASVGNLLGRYSFARYEALFPLFVGLMVEHYLFLKNKEA